MVDEVNRYVKRVGKVCMYVNIVRKRKGWKKEGEEARGGEQKNYIFYYKVLL